MNTIYGQASGDARQVNISTNYGQLTLTTTPATATFAHQLPADAGDFTGRESQVQQLEEWLMQDSPVPVVVGISGKPGVGKSALAIRVARRMITRFPDAQLYVNLRGHDGQPSRPGDVLTGFLRALGMPATQIPDGEQDRAGAFRSLLEDGSGKVLIVLDNARDAGQVRPLLPGNAHCAVLITSRTPLVTLAGAHLLDLEVMTEKEAIQLLYRVSDRQWTQDDASSASAVVRACGWLPLAVRISGALLKQKTYWSPSKLRDELAHEQSRLDLLQVGDLDVRASFMLSYHDLTPDDAMTFRLLSLLPPADFPPEPVAAMLDTRRRLAERLLDRLSDAQLVEVIAESRFRLHDLIRIFAREQRKADSDQENVSRARAALDTYASSFEARYNAQLRADYSRSGAVLGHDRMPIDEIYIPQRIVPVDRIGAVDVPYTYAVQPGQTAIVVGEFGSGKTTMARRICLDLADGSLSGVAQVGFIVRPRELAAAEKPLDQFLSANLRADFQLDVPPDALTIKFHTGQAAVIFDGLDEVIDEDKRLEVIHLINSFRRNYPRVSIVITSRMLEGDLTLYFPYSIMYHIGLLSPTDVRGYLGHLESIASREVGKIPAEVSEALLSLNKEVGGIGQSPLILGLLWQLYQQTGKLPRSFADLYGAVWRLSFGQSQHARSLEGIAPDDIPNLFEYIAYRMSDTLGVDSSITRSKLIEIIEHYLSEKGAPGDSRDPTIKLIQWIREQTEVFTELGDSPEQSYGFALRGIREYGAASWLVRSHLTADTLANEIVSKATKDSWRGIIELALAIYRDRHNNDDLISAIKKKELQDGNQSNFLEDLL